MKTISSHDREILRKLAARQSELAASEKNQKRIVNWIKHNSFSGELPMIHLELWTFKHEVIEPLLACTEDTARNIERTLYANFINQELFDDDKIVPSNFHVSWNTYFVPFGIDLKVTHASDNGLGHHFEEALEDLERDFHKLGPSRYGANREATQLSMDMLNDIFGDILPVKQVMNSLDVGLTRDIVHIMSMQNMFMSLYDYPNLFHEMMKRLTDDYIAYFDWLSQENLILPTVYDEWLNQGSLCFTSELPGEAELAKRVFTSCDVWGYMDSQETVGLSPEMFVEFIFPYYERISTHFGLLSYGCCEPVHPYWDECLSSFNNLRKISISPWCNEEAMGEKLRGRQTIFHRKPSPNFLGTGTVLDEEAFRAHIRKSLFAAKGCKMEITQRDVYTINHDIAKAKHYIAIIREEIENHWKG